MFGGRGVIWITGLSGAGKTTLARGVVHALRQRGEGGATIVHVDGDEMRELFGNDLRHDLADRRANAWRIAKTCKFLASQGCFVVCSTVSMFQEIWTHNRTHIRPYLEVLLDVPADVLAARDTKGLYARGARDVAGIDLTVARPSSPDLVLASDGDDDLAQNIALLVTHAHAMQCRPVARRSA